MNIISLGAGVQSSTMALMAAHGEITPMPDAAIFADTQAEPEAVYEWLDWLKKQLPFPVIRVSKGNLQRETLRQRTSKKGRNYYKLYVPSYGENGPMPRKCTTDFKLVPLYAHLRQWRPVTIWIGISLDEAYRMKEPFRKWVINRYPLVDLRIRRSDCLLWMERAGYPKPPRSACIFCPYHSDQEWRDLPSSEFAQAVEFERQLPAGEFLHRKRVPLDQVDFSTDEDRGQLNMFNNECEGMCGV